MVKPRKTKFWIHLIARWRHIDRGCRLMKNFFLHTYYNATNYNSFPACSKVLYLFHKNLKHLHIPIFRKNFIKANMHRSIVIQKQNIFFIFSWPAFQAIYEMGKRWRKHQKLSTIYDDVYRKRICSTWAVRKHGQGKAALVKTTV